MKVKGWMATLLLGSVLCLQGCNNTGTLQADIIETVPPQVDQKSAKTVLEVGKEKVPYNEVVYYTSIIKNRYENLYGSGIWNYEIEPGTTLEQLAKEDVFQLIVQIKVITQKAEELGVSLTEDELAEAQEYAINTIEQMDEETKSRYDIDEALLQTVYEDNLLAIKTFEVATNGVDTYVSDEEAKQVTIQKLLIMTNGQDKNGNHIAMSEDEQKQAYSRAKDLLKQAKETSDFESFAISNSDLSEVTVSVGESDLNEELSKAVFALKSQEFSKVISTEEGYYIIYCVNDFDEDATALKKEEIIQERQNQMFKQLYETWSAQYDVETKDKLWNAIEIAELNGNLEDEALSAMLSK